MLSPAHPRLTVFAPIVSRPGRHSTSKQTVVATKKLLEKADLPFVAAEAGLDRDLSAVTDASGVKAAMDKAVKAGARPGCAALKTGELLVTLFAKDAEAAMKKRPAAPKKTVQGAGWVGGEQDAVVTNATNATNAIGPRGARDLRAGAETETW